MRFHVRNVNVYNLFLLVTIDSVLSYPQHSGNTVRKTKVLPARRDDVLSESVEITKDGIVGNVETLDMPQQQTGDGYDNVKLAGSGESITIPSGLDGSIVQNGQDKNQQLAGDQLNDHEPAESDFITGNIEINKENIEGSIELPSGIDQMPIMGEQNDKANFAEAGNDNQVEGDALSATVEINDENVEGHVEIPSNVENSKEEMQPDNSKGHINNDGDVLSASFEFGDENIEGHINLPDDGVEGEPNEYGALSGTVEINDAAVEGNINIGSNGDQEDSNDDGQGVSPIAKDPQSAKVNSKSENNCWMTLNAKHHIDALDNLDAKYQTARKKYQDDIGKEFDRKMMEVLLTSQGKAPRAIHQAEGDPSQIPAGLALGGTCMMRMPGSVLFFHRMKLRNSTRFTVNFVNTDLVNMVQIARLSLNDLHLKGAYERLTSDQDPSNLFYVPNVGEIEVLVKSVVYKMEGHLRMLNNRLIIELVNSDLLTRDILMTYVNSNDSSSISLQPRNIEDFLERLKTDLDFWLKDYFNDYLMYFGIVGKGGDVLEYEKKKTIRVNEYADDVVKSIKGRIQDLGMSSVKLPHFTIFSVLNTEIKLLDGVVRGLDSIYRRSVATTKKMDIIRQLDFIVGFSKLKVEYKYEAIVSEGTPPIAGKLIMSANDISAHIENTHISNPEAIDIILDTIIQTKPESLTVEGPVNRLIANFKALLEHPIIAIMSNTLKHNIKMMKTLPRCDPYIYGKEKHKPHKPRTTQSPYVPDHADNDIDENEDISPEAGGNSDLGSEDDNGDETSKNDKDWSDYMLSKNDSIEIEVPVKGKKETFKLHRDENIVLSKVDT